MPRATTTRRAGIRFPTPGSTGMATVAGVMTSTDPEATAIGRATTDGGEYGIADVSTNMRMIMDFVMEDLFP